MILLLINNHYAKEKCGFFFHSIYADWLINHFNIENGSYFFDSNDIFYQWFFDTIVRLYGVKIKKVPAIAGTFY